MSYKRELIFCLIVVCAFGILISGCKTNLLGSLYSSDKSKHNNNMDITGLKKDSQESTINSEKIDSVKNVQGISATGISIILGAVGSLLVTVFAIGKKFDNKKTKILMQKKDYLWAAVQIIEKENPDVVKELVYVYNKLKRELNNIK